MRLSAPAPQKRRHGAGGVAIYAVCCTGSMLIIAWRVSRKTWAGEKYGSGGIEMINETHKALQFYSEWQAMVAVILGMILQFALGDKRGTKIAFVIGLSSVFVALFIVPAIIEVVGLNPAGKIAIALYALSAIVSVEMLAIMIRILPEAMRIRTKRFLGVENDVQ